MESVLGALGDPVKPLRVTRSDTADRSWTAREKFGRNFGPLTPNHHRKPGNTRDQRARRINKIENLAKSAKPPSPVQIRAAPPISSVNSIVCARAAQADAFQLDYSGLQVAGRRRRSFTQIADRQWVDVSAAEEGGGFQDLRLGCTQGAAQKPIRSWPLVRWVLSRHVAASTDARRGRCLARDLAEARCKDYAFERVLPVAASAFACSCRDRGEGWGRAGCGCRYPGQLTRALDRRRAFSQSSSSSSRNRDRSIALASAR